MRWADGGRMRLYLGSELPFIPRRLCSGLTLLPHEELISTVLRFSVSAAPTYRWRFNTSAGADLKKKTAVNITELCIVGSVQRHANWFNRFALLSVHRPLCFLEPLMSSRKEILFLKIDFLPHWLAHSYSNRWIPATVSALLRFNLFTRADFRPRFSVIENNNLPRGFSKQNTDSEKSLCVNMLVMSLAHTKLCDWKRSLK